MVAAMLYRDDRLLNWLKIVAEIRFNTELCEEYQPCLLYQDLFQWRDSDDLTPQVYNHALIMVADIESRFAAGKRYGTSKI